MPGPVGIALPGSYAAETIYQIYEYSRGVFFNEAPLFLGLPRDQATAERFSMGADRVRSKALTFAAAVADGVATTFTISDVSGLMQGDVLLLNSGERVEVTSDPTVATPSTGQGTVTVRRGAEGTTGAAQANGSAIVVLYNSRTGGEVDQTGSRQNVPLITQNVQTFQYPVQMAGKTRASRGIATSGGREPFRVAQDIKLRELNRDAETAVLYGIGEFNVGASRQKMKGIRQIISEGFSANLITSPANAGAYTPTDLNRDAFRRVIDQGGRPDTLIVSSQFSDCFTRWGWSKLYVTPEMRAVGTSWNNVKIPLVDYDITVILDPQLRGFTAAAFETEGEAPDAGVRLRFLRQEFWNERGNRGDAVEGEWLCDFAVDVSDPSHHAWVEGVTAFGAA